MVSEGGHSGNLFRSSFGVLCKYSNFCFFSKLNPCYRESILADDVEKKSSSRCRESRNHSASRQELSMYPSVTCGFLSLEESFSLKNKLSLPLPPPLPHFLTRSSALKCHTREGRWAWTAGPQPISQLWRLSPGKEQTCPQGHGNLLQSIFVFNIFHQELLIGSALGEGSIWLL